MGHISNQLAAHIFCLVELFSHHVKRKRELVQFIRVFDSCAGGNLDPLLVMSIGNHSAGGGHLLQRSNHPAADQETDSQSNDKCR